ncbi:hypothetical protein XELAEV_18046768mg [Xenopus laevis]|uniref:Uncharacterized protein n=1 Tax=Xenopus laevis TaxID=8355 RepID=A0A974BTZ7_XENLA|nr:hypothetical protein XELAEV_18046768mg [Xenopus laevis]
MSLIQGGTVAGAVCGFQYVQHVIWHLSNLVAFCKFGFAGLHYRYHQRAACPSHRNRRPSLNEVTESCNEN